MNDIRLARRFPLGFPRVKVGWRLRVEACHVRAVFCVVLGAEVATVNRGFVAILIFAECCAVQLRVVGRERGGVVVVLATASAVTGGVQVVLAVCAFHCVAP